MRRLASGLTLLLLCLPAIQPYLVGDFPRTNDAATHLYRAFELDRLIRDGVFVPRWGPDFALGYGYPTFNYFPYLSHYLIEAFHLAGLPFLWSMRSAFALALVGAAFSARALASDLFSSSEAAGLVAAIAYVYSPYLLYTANVRGGLPESLLLAWLPLALLSVRRLALGQWRWLPVCSLVVAAMAFSHLGGLVQTGPFVAIYALVSLREGHKAQDQSHKAQGSRLKPKDPSHMAQATRLKEIQSPTHDQTAQRNNRLRITRYVLRFTPYVLRITPYASRLAVLALAGILGLALPAFQWLPARAEMGFVRLVEGFSGAGITYNLNFFRLADLAAWPRLPVDLDLLNPPLARPLPWVAVALALVCLLCWRVFTRDVRRLIVFFGCMLLVSAFLTLNLSRPVWDRIPLLQQTLWPWRFLGPASLAAAVLAGGAFAGTPPITNYRSRITHYVLRFTHSCPLLALSLLLLASLPWLYPPREPLPERPSLADLARAEIPPLLVGTTTTGEYTPVWVQRWPEAGAMRSEQLAGRDPDRLDAASLPAGASSAITVRNRLSVTYLLDMPAAARLIYRTFYFPGWEADLDGRPLALRPTEPEGLISFEMPAGQHVVTLRFADTPIRRGAGAVSLAALGLVVAAVGLVISRQSPVISRQSSVGCRQARVGSHTHGSRVTHYTIDSIENSERLPGISPESAFICVHRRFLPYFRKSLLRFTFYVSHPTHDPWLLITASLLLAKLALLDTGLVPLVRHGLRDGRLAGASHPLDVDFSGELRLLGYDVSPEAFAAGDSATVNLYWRAQRPLGVPYGMNVRLVDGRGLAWSGSDIRRPADFRFFPGADNWPPDQYILDPYVLEPVAGTPPGSYELEVVAYRQSDLQAIGTARIGQVQIVAPQRVPAGAPAPEATFGSALALVSHRLDRAAAAPGDPTLVTLLWQAEAQAPTDLRARLELAAGRTGESVFSHDFTIVEGYPSSRWRVGDLLTDQVLLRLPATLESGEYAWRLVVLDEAGAPIAAPVLLSDQGAFTVTAPARSFEVPEVVHLVEADLGGLVRLAGYNLSSDIAHPGEAVTVSLIWQALADMPISYHVFLHLTDLGGGSIVAQSDGMPADWTRPTTGWVPGEFVVDDRALSLPADLPAGAYVLWAGMDDPSTGERLLAPGFPDGRVRLSTLLVSP